MTPEILIWRRALAPGALPGFGAGPADRFHWAEPARGFALTGHGCVAAVEARGRDRFRVLTRELTDHGRRLRVQDESGREGPFPAWLGGFAFDDEAETRWVLPAHLVLHEGGRAWEQRATRLAPGEDPETARARLEAAPIPPPAGRPAPPRIVSRAAGGDDYAARVERALEAIHAGSLEKVVVARSLDVRAAGPFDVDAVLASLAARHPGCRVFGVGRGDETFLGATPERLVRAVGGRVRADALAGTAPRGADPAADAEAARGLRESKKEQEEHAVVVRALRAALAPFCERLDVDESPRVRRFASVQHLHTRAVGRLHRDVPFPLLALAEGIHPTPAVGGEPRDEALAWLRREEGLERGWYAGGIGWMDPAGEGELAVALRCARVRGADATLYAGAGIVADSEPAAELRETRLKLRAMLGALGGPAR